jgi:peptide/nickel transport system substrate-binding protein
VTLIIGAGVLAWIKFDKSKVKDNSVAENLSREVEKDTAVIGLRYLSAEKLYPENEGQFSAINFNYNLFEGLASFDRENRIVPVLAKSWDNPNNSTWRFHINQEAKFSNGAPVTANDVKFTYDYVNENQDFEMSQAMPPAEVKVIDDYTVEFITKKPDPLLLNKLALYLMVLSENEVKANGVKNHIGSGPYIFASRDENTVTLIRNENYWREKAKVKTAIFKVIPDEKDRVEALLRGEIDFTSYGFTSKEAKDLAEQAISENKVQKKQVLDQSVTYLSIDVDRDKSPYVDTTPNPLKNLKVRQAMYEAINVEDIANQALFKIVGASQLVSSGIFGYNPSIKRPAFDLEHAKSLMKEAGYENGFGFSLDYRCSRMARSRRSSRSSTSRTCR